MKALPTNSSPPLLSLKGISFAYNTPKSEIPALDNIYLDIMPQSFTSIVGPSGCGKSTLLSIICGLLSPQKGEVVFNNDILHDKEHLENVDNMLKEYGLYQFCNVHPSELSGGMRQRAALIRTLALNPDILLLDEPFSALDYQTRLEVSDDIGKIIKEQKKTAILVTHDISEAISMGDSVVILSHRPAHIKKVVNINLSIPDRTPFTSRQAPEFAGYFNEIWEDIQ